MKNLIACLLFLVGVTAHAANPSMAQLNFASNSLVAQIIAAGVWTKTNNTIYPTTQTNQLALGDISSLGQIAAGALVALHSLNVEGSAIGTLSVTRTLTSNIPRIIVINTTLDGESFASDDGVAVQGLNITQGKNDGLLDFNVGGVGVYGRAGSQLGGATNGAVGVVGLAYGNEGLSAGVAGVVDSFASGNTNVGVSGRVITEGNTGVFIGGYFDVHRNYGDTALLEPAAVLADSFETGVPLIIARTNNGTFKAFQVNGDKTTNATPFDAGDLLSAYNGVATLLHATSTNSLITVGSSPFNYTNTAAQTIVLYLDANGATTAVKLNGTQIFASLAAGDHTIILKPGAYTTVTYAIATPVMTWTEL